MTRLAKILFYIFGILGLSTRLLVTNSLFFLRHDTLILIGIISGIIAIISGLTFLILSFIKGIKRQLKYLFGFIIILLIIFLFPFEYVFGWTLYQYSRVERNRIMTNLRTSKYDSLISKSNYSNYTWINDKPSIKIFKDSSLQMIFISHADISSYDYYGMFYISDSSRIKDKIVNDFIYSEYNKKYLGDNWYLIECYIDTTPAP